MDRYLQNFLWNFPQGNVPRPQWWLVNIAIRQVLLTPYDVPGPQWVEFCFHNFLGMRPDSRKFILCLIPNKNYPDTVENPDLAEQFRIQSSAVIMQSNIHVVRYCINNCWNWGRISAGSTNDTSYLTLMESGGVSWYFWENWLHYNGTTLYQSHQLLWSSLWSSESSKLSVKIGSAGNGLFPNGTLKRQFRYLLPEPVWI